MLMKKNLTSNKMINNIKEFLGKLNKSSQKTRKKKQNKSKKSQSSLIPLKPQKFSSELQIKVIQNNFKDYASTIYLGDDDSMDMDEESII